MGRGTSSPGVAVQIEAAPELNLAMVENAVPLVARVSVTNDSADELANLMVEAALLPDFSAKWSAHVAAIPPGATFNVDDIDLPLDRARLVNQLERGAGELVVWVRQADASVPIATHRRRVDVLAYNEWSPATVPQLLAAFVLPNHPAIVDLVRTARQPLERLTGSPALDGYQSGDPRRVAAIARSVYESLQARGVTYSNPPASFERIGQKIRTPEQVVDDQLATCLDITVTLAACLENVGLHPVCVLVEGHAFPGVWLDDFYVAEAVLDDGATIRKAIELDRLLVFDSSCAVKRPEVGFAEARTVARQCLDETPHVWTVDITGARKQHYRPLPVRVAGYGAAIEVPAVTTTEAAPLPRSMPSSGSAPHRAAPRPRHPRVEAWKKGLLDTSLRNRLMNFRDTQKNLSLLCDDLGRIEDLIAKGEQLLLRPRPALLGGDDPRSRKLLEAHGAVDALNRFLGERLGHGELYTEHPSDVTTARLTSIYRAAREVLEETGTNELCLTFGMLHWYESETSDVVRRAPILLVPVALARNARSSTFTLQATGEDVRLNVTLFEKLRIDTGITLPELDELPGDESGVDVAAVLRIVRQAVLNLPRWEVKDELHLGLFSFAKFQMWADLDQNLDAMLESPVVRHLLEGQGAPYPNQGGFPAPASMDSIYAPKDLLCPLDADASQLAAVAAAAEGRTFVLQGPPGTGKSQTITNVIAHCIAQGKRVLFVAEKAAALEVVHRRLTSVGLAPYVLELHSHKSGKKQVLEQLRAALETNAVATSAAWDQETRRLQEERSYLNRYVAALHQDRGGGATAFRAFAELDRLRDVASYELPSRYVVDADARDRVVAQLEALRAAMSALDPFRDSPWQGCALPGWSVDHPMQVGAALDRGLAALHALRDAAGSLARHLGANDPETLRDVEAICAVAELLDGAPPSGARLQDAAEWPRAEQEAEEISSLVRRRHDALGALRPRYTERLFELDLDGLAGRLEKLGRSFFLFAWWGFRKIRKAIVSATREGRAPARDELTHDVERARTARDLARRIAEHEPLARTVFGDAWAGDATDPSPLDAALRWARSFHQARGSVRSGLLPGSLQASEGLGELAAETRRHLAAVREALAALDRLLGVAAATGDRGGDGLPALGHRLTRWRNDLHQLPAWNAYRAAAAELTRAGCATLVDAAAKGDLPLDQLAPAFRRGIHQAWVREVAASEPMLATFNGDDHRRRVETFAATDRRVLGLGATEAVARVARRAPAVSEAAGGEMGTLRRELQKQRRYMPIRKLLSQIPNVVAQLKPCFLMSPMSVATYLEPRARFDVVVFDEASQIPTYDAIGVFARGRSAVVVGDSRQLPPTSFFSAGTGDDADSDEDFDELESILDESIAAGLPERQLDWHYRSRHESLIAFSNFHYYKNKLNTFPSAFESAHGRGVRLVPVAGHYDKGAARTNRAEAEAVVRDLVERLRAPDADRRTYGIVTFSMAQQALVEDLLDAARSRHPEIEQFFSDERPEPVIVKNLENIQGDERDVMIFSICYGPDQTRKVSMNFGPLNREGGERRLNVAITRAREELVVYATLSPEQIDLTRTRALGVKHLKTFLDYARRGPAAIAEALIVHGADVFDSPFEEQVCDRLRSRGFTVHTQVGCAGYRIDMAVCDPARPGRYLLGIECDGAHYHSARSARERDRLRTQVLEGLGWRIHRVWSTDWWQAPDRELEKIVGAIERARVDAAQEPAEAAAPPPSAPVAAAPAVRVAHPLVEAKPVATAPPRVPTQPVAGAAPATSRRAIIPYRAVTVPENRRDPDDIHDARYQAELRELLQEIVVVEAPVSVRLLARRVAPYFGIQRTSKRLEERLYSVLGRSVRIRDGFVWRIDQEPAHYVEARVAAEDTRREAADVPVEEVANAALFVLRASIALEHDELVKLTARELGFKRTGQNVAAQIAAGVTYLLETGRVRRDDDKIVLSA